MNAPAHIAWLRLLAVLAVLALSGDVAAATVLRTPPEVHLLELAPKTRVSLRELAVGARYRLEVQGAPAPRPLYTQLRELIGEDIAEVRRLDASPEKRRFEILLRRPSRRLAVSAPPQMSRLHLTVFDGGEALLDRPDLPDLVPFSTLFHFDPIEALPPPQPIVGLADSPKLILAWELMSTGDVDAADLMLRSTLEGRARTNNWSLALALLLEVRHRRARKRSAAEGPPRFLVRECRDALTRAAGTRPEWRIRYLLAAAHLVNGNAAEAEAELHWALRREPPEHARATIQYGLARAIMQRRQDSRTMELLEAASQHGRSQPAALAALELARDALAQRRFPAARRHLALALKHARSLILDTPWVQLLLAESRFFEGDVDRAERLYARLAKQHVGTPEVGVASLRLGDIAKFKRKQLPLAMRRYRDAVEQNGGTDGGQLAMMRLMLFTSPEDDPQRLHTAMRVLRRVSARAAKLEASFVALRHQLRAREWMRAHELILEMQKAELIGGLGNRSRKKLEVLAGNLVIAATAEGHWLDAVTIYEWHQPRLAGLEHEATIHFSAGRAYAALSRHTQAIAAQRQVLKLLRRGHVVARALEVMTRSYLELEDTFRAHRTLKYFHNQRAALGREQQRLALESFAAQRRGEVELAASRLLEAGTRAAAPELRASKAALAAELLLAADAPAPARKALGIAIRAARGIPDRRLPPRAAYAQLRLADLLLGAAEPAAARKEYAAALDRAKAAKDEAGARRSQFGLARCDVALGALELAGASLRALEGDADAKEPVKPDLLGRLAAATKEEIAWYERYDDALVEARRALSPADTAQVEETR